MSERHSLGVDLLRIAVPLAIVAVGVGVFITMGALTRSPETKADEHTVPLVETVPVEVHEGGLDIEVDGVVVPYREIALAAEVAGRIQFKDEQCRGGRYVSKGKLLFRIDPRDYALEVRRLTRSLNQAKADLNEIAVEEANTRSLIALAEEDLRLQRNEIARLMELIDRKVVTDSALDKARQAEVAARNALMMQQNQIQLLKARRNRLIEAQAFVTAQLERAQLDLQRTEIFAPVDGVVVDDLVEQDSYVQKGTQLAHLEDTSAVEIECNLRMDELNWIWRSRGVAVGQAASPGADYQLPPTPVTVVFTLAGVDYLWQGTLDRYDGIGLDEKTRMVPCRVVVGQPRSVQVRGEQGAPTPAADGPAALVRGMFVKIDIHVDPPATLLSLPDRAVRPRGEVWKLRDGKLVFQPIKVAERLGDRVLIQSDGNTLSPADRVIVGPVPDAEQGMTLQEVPPR